MIHKVLKYKEKSLIRGGSLQHAMLFVICFLVSYSVKHRDIHPTNNLTGAWGCTLCLTSKAQLTTFQVIHQIFSPQRSAAAVQDKPANHKQLQFLHWDEHEDRVCVGRGCRVGGGEKIVPLELPIECSMAPPAQCRGRLPPPCTGLKHRIGYTSFLETPCIPTQLPAGMGEGQEQQWAGVGRGRPAGSQGPMGQAAGSWAQVLERQEAGGKQVEESHVWGKLGFPWPGPSWS